MTAKCCPERWKVNVVTNKKCNNNNNKNYFIPWATTYGPFCFTCLWPIICFPVFCSSATLTPFLINSSSCGVHVVRERLAGETFACARVCEWVQKATDTGSRTQNTWVMVRHHRVCDLPIDAFRTRRQFGRKCVAVQQAHRRRRDVSSPVPLFQATESNNALPTRPGRCAIRSRRAARHMRPPLL